jgi:hypothetical protein
MRATGAKTFKINSSMLHLPLCDETCLVLDHCVGHILLDLVDPFEVDGTVSVRQLCQLLCTILLDGVDLFLHRHVPSSIMLYFDECRQLFFSSSELQLLLHQTWSFTQCMLKHSMSLLWHMLIVTDDVVNATVVDWQLIMEHAQPVLIVVEWRRELRGHLRH